MTIILLGGVAWEAIATVLQHRNRIEPMDWRAAVELLRQKHRPGEPVLAAPDWANPVALQHLAGLVDIEMAGLSDVDRFGRVWELSIRGHKHRWLSARVPSQIFAPSRVTLSLYEQTPVQVLFDFRKQITRASVEVISNRRATCPRQGDGFVCGPAPELWVGVKLGEIDHRPYHCIQAHPIAGARLRLSYAAVPLGRQIVGYTGIDGFQNRRGEKAPVYMQVLVDGELIHTIMQPNEGHWTRFVADTHAFRGETHQLWFELTSADVRDRTFCFHAEARQ